MRDDLRARNAFRSAAFATVLNIVGTPLGMLVARAVPSTPVWPRALAIGLALGFLLVLAVRRHKPSTRLGSGLFLVNIALVLVAAWTTNHAAAASGQVWAPFQGNKIAMLVVAVLATELWVGMVSIAACVGVAIFQMSTFSEAARAHFAVNEPMATWAVAVIAAIVLVYRIRQTDLQQEVLRARAEGAALARLARVLLGVRDLSNTPLQTIAFSSAVVRAQRPDLAPECDLIDDAVADMKSLNVRLREYEHAIDWSEADESIEPFTAAPKSS